MTHDELEVRISQAEGLLMEAREVAKEASAEWHRLDRELTKATETVRTSKTAVTEARHLVTRLLEDQVREYADRDVKTGQWSTDELAAVLLANKPLLRVAMTLNRSYEDTRVAAKALAEAWNSNPVATAQMLGFTRKQFTDRHHMSELNLNPVVCVECFTTPHQITCSKAA